MLFLKGRMPIHGNESNFNINSLLYQNIMESEYFKALYQLRTYHEVIDEIYKRVPHVAPWQTGTSRIPSTGTKNILNSINKINSLIQLIYNINPQPIPFAKIFKRSVYSPNF